MKNKTIPVNFNNLGELLVEDEKAAQICHYFANRRNNTKTISVDDLSRRVKGCNYRKTYSVLKHFAATGAGEIVQGRKGYPSRFDWYVSSKDFAETALESEQATYNLLAQLQDMDADEDDEDYSERDLSNGHVDHNAAVKHTFALRTDWMVRIALPNDLTRHEAQRLRAFISTLPFSE